MNRPELAFRISSRMLPPFRGSTPILLANKMVYELDWEFQISVREEQDDRDKYYMPIRPILGISDFRD
ncbi:hypothetical protein [Methanothrix sp.]|uniref:hypothetical protein n=1 Tax=Methanothrix sp. TaxID=90426 RepID=UPI003BAF26E3